jgi:hypothetical protein
MLSSYRDYWESLPVNREIFRIIERPLKDGVTFQLPIQTIRNEIGQEYDHKTLQDVPGFLIYCYKDNDTYYCKVTNDVRRAILRHYKV